MQVVPFPPAVATAFIEMVSGTAAISYDASKGEITITSAGGVIKNVLLLVGEWTEKPPYVAKGYAEELAECKRYYYQSWDGPDKTFYGIVIRTAIGTTRLCNVELPCEMRIPPSITLYNGHDRSAESISSYKTSTILTRASAVYTNTKSFVPGIYAPFDTGMCIEGEAYAFHYEAIADL